MTTSCSIACKPVTMESCPDCGRKLVVSWECGFCGWKDETEAELMGIDIKDDKTLRKVGKWTNAQMVTMILISIVIPFFGVFASIYGMFDNQKRKQGAFLLLVTVFASVLMRMILTAGGYIS